MTHRAANPGSGRAPEARSPVRVSQRQIYLRLLHLCAPPLGIPDRRIQGTSEVNRAENRHPKGTSRPGPWSKTGYKCVSKPALLHTYGRKSRLHTLQKADRTSSNRQESTMSRLTRRLLLKSTPVTGAAMTLLPAAPAPAAVAPSPNTAIPRPPASPVGSMVIYVEDFSTGELKLLVGSREIVVRDPALVARFARTIS